MAQQKVEHLKTVRARKGNIVVWVCYTQEFAQALVKDVADRSPETTTALFQINKENEEGRDVWVVTMPKIVFENCYSDRKPHIHIYGGVIQLDFTKPLIDLNHLTKCFEGTKQIILEFNDWFVKNQDLFKNNDAIADEIRKAILETGEDKNSIEFVKDPEVIVKILCQNIEKLKKYWQHKITFYSFSSEKKAIDSVDTILKQNPVNKKFLLTNQNNMNTRNPSSTSSSSSTSAPSSTAGPFAASKYSSSIASATATQTDLGFSDDKQFIYEQQVAFEKYNMAKKDKSSSTTSTKTTQTDSESSDNESFIYAQQIALEEYSKAKIDKSNRSSSTTSSSSISTPSSTASVSAGVNHSGPTDASAPQNFSSVPATTPTSLETSEYDEEIPENYCCPITQDIMTDPVIIKSGHTFERKNITDWVSGKKTCPITRESINSDDLIIPNRALKNEIDAWKEKHKSKKSESPSSTSSYLNPTRTSTQANNNSYPSSPSNYTNYTGAFGPGNSEYNLWASSSAQPQPNPPQNNHYSQPHSSFGHRN